MSGKPQRCTIVILCVPLILGAPGCAKFKAGSQPHKKDLSFLSPGTPRRYVVAELGPPVQTETTPAGRSDRYRFVQGYSKSTIALRQTGHIMGDIMTLGLWEIVGVPLENMADGTPVEVRVLYDSAGRIVSVTGISGMNVLSRYDIPDEADAQHEPGHLAPNDFSVP